MRNLKRVLSLALALVMVLGMMVIGTSAATYTDADQIEYKEAIAVMSGIGLYEGNPDGSLAPKQVLNRAMAAVIMTRIILGDKADNLIATKQIFSDVPVNAWYAEEVEYCYNTGLIAGNGNGTFTPDAELTGIAFAKLLLVAMGYDADEQGYVGKDWSTNIAVDALTAGLYIKNVDIAGKLTREQAAQMILQALDGEMVQYINTFDKATGKATIVGPLPTDVTFADAYYPSLEKVTGGYGMWGRPIAFQWFYNNKAIYSVMKTPVKTYTTAVFECDIAEDLGLRYDADITKATLNNEATKVNNSEINLLATKVKVGAQGRLTEIYSNGKGGYEVVMIDTFLAKVTDVTECTYDRNGHLDEYAELSLIVYLTEEEYEEFTLYSDEDWSFEAGEWLLTYYDEYWAEPVIYGYAESLKGAQTAYTTVETHEVEEVEYDDSHTFYLDEAGNSTADHTWFFDQYGNLIGVIDIPAAPATYGVISSIYWKDSRDGELGYAYAKITYMDGSSEWQKIAKINGVTLKGVEGRNSSYKEGIVSSSKQYNEDKELDDDSVFVNRALYAIHDGRDGLELTETFFVKKGQLTTKQKTVVDGEVYVNSKTVFLTYNSHKGTYTTYVGVRNLPKFEDDAAKMWVADITDDTLAEYVFVVDPKTKDITKVHVLADEEMRMNVELTRGGTRIFKYSDILVNGRAGSICFVEEDEELMEEFLQWVGTPLVLTIDHGYVVKIEFGGEIVITDKPYVAYRYAGTLAAGSDDAGDGICSYDSDDKSLLIDDEWYDVRSAKLIGARSWKAAEGKKIVVIYDANLIVSFVYVF